MGKVENDIRRRIGGRRWWRVEVIWMEAWRRGEEKDRGEVEERKRKDKDEENERIVERRE